MSKRHLLLAVAGLTAGFLFVLAIGATAAFLGHVLLDLSWQALNVEALVGGIL